MVSNPGVRPAWRLLALATLLTSFSVAPAALAQPAPQAPRPFADLTQLADDVYAWRYRGYDTIFIVTGEGVIASDPIGITNPREPDLFKAVIRSVTDQPVRYLIYSHGNADHAFGADVFADTATLVATQAAAAKLAALNSPRHPAPTLIVNDYLRLELGGVAVDLYWPGPTQGDDHLIVHYPARRILFAVDFIPVMRLPFRDLPGATSIDAWVNSLAWIEETLDFDVLVPGHGELGNKESVRAVRGYLQELTAAIRAAQARGLADSSEEMTAAVRIDLAPRYGSWEAFDEYLPLNITGVIRVWSGT